MAEPAWHDDTQRSDTQSSDTQRSDTQRSDSRSAETPGSSAGTGNVLVSTLLFPLHATDATIRFGLKTLGILRRGGRS